MKQIFLLISALLISAIGIGQSLTFDQLLSLRGKDLEAVEEFLTARKWSFMEASEASDDKCEATDFAYEPSDFDESKAVAFLGYYKCIFGTRISYQTHNTKTYTAIISRIKALGYKSLESKVEDGAIVKIYQGKSVIIKIITASSEGAFGGKKTTYQITLYNKMDYDMQNP